MGTKNNPGKFDCYANAHPDEPMFVLLGRDKIGGSLVRLWAAVREVFRDDPKKVAEAHQCAEAMDAWSKKGGLRHEVMEWLPFDLLAAEWKRRGLPMPATPEAMPAVRNADGHWFHPDWPARATPDETSEAPTARALGLELSCVSMEHQVSDEAWEAYGDSNSPDCLAWEPEPPDEDPAWFLTAIFDTEDGPVAHWCRPLPQPEPPRDNEATSDLLSLVGIDAPAEVVATWPDEDVKAACEWAGCTHLHASDNDDVVVPPRPAFIPAPWTGPMQGDGIWASNPTPIRVEAA